MSIRPSPAEELLSLLLLSCESGTLRRLILSAPREKTAPRVTARLTRQRGIAYLTLEYAYPNGDVRQQHLTKEKISSAVAPLLPLYDRVNLLTGAGDTELMRSKKGKETLRGGGALRQALTQGGRPLPQFVGEVDRKKTHLLSGEEDFLIPLGIADKNHRIHDKRQAKFRQINRFLEYLADLYEKLPSDGPLLVYDLCCGKSYLSFAVYYYLHDMRHREVDMLCMDLKAEVMRNCTDIARASGFDGMTFRAGDVRHAPRDRRPHLVLSLHACDIATDIVLDTAIALGAELILSTPCCHRYLSKRIHCAPLSFVTDYPHLNDKLCEVLTDGERIARLRAAGYRVTAPELTDPDDTPKNTLIRAVRRHDFSPDSREAERLRAEHQTILRYLLGDEGAAHYLEDIR